MATNVTHIGGQRAGFSEGAIEGLRKALEEAIAQGEHVAICAVFVRGTRVDSITSEAHARGSVSPPVELSRALYRAGHRMLVEG